jgi:hypothetical protein
MVQHSATSCNMIGRAGISDARASRAARYPTRHSIRRGRLLCHEPLELWEVRRAHVRCTLIDQPLPRTPCNGHRATDTVQRTTRNGQRATCACASRSALHQATCAPHAAQHSIARAHAVSEPTLHLGVSPAGPGADVAGASPIPSQVRDGCAQSRCRCGRGEPNPVAGAGRVRPVPVQMWAGCAHFPVCHALPAVSN